MEDTLIDGKPVSWLDATTVLILVLMEDTLRETSLGTKRESIYSLNPCFNGRYSQRKVKGINVLPKES